MTITADLDARLNEYTRRTEDANRNGWLKSPEPGTGRAGRPGIHLNVLAFLLRRTSVARNADGVATDAVASAAGTYVQGAI